MLLSANSFGLGFSVKVNGNNQIFQPRIQIYGLKANFTFRSFAALFADLHAEYQRTERKRHSDTLVFRVFLRRTGCCLSLSCLRRHLESPICCNQPLIRG